MNKSVSVLIVIIIIFSSMLIYKFYETSKLNENYVSLKNEVARKDKVILNKDSSYSKLMLEYVSQDSMEIMLKKHNADLLKDIKSKNQKIAFLSSVTVSPETVIVSNETFIRDSILFFKGYTEPYTVNGEIYLSDYKTRKLTVVMDDFKLLVTGGKLQNGMFNATIKFTNLDNKPLKMFKVVDIESAINTNVDKEEDKFIQFGIGGEFGLNDTKLGMAFNILKNNIITVNYSVVNFDINSYIDYSHKITVGYYRMF